MRKGEKGETQVPLMPKLGARGLVCRGSWFVMKMVLMSTKEAWLRTLLHTSKESSQGCEMCNCSIPHLSRIRPVPLDRVLYILVVPSLRLKTSTCDYLWHWEGILHLFCNSHTWSQLWLMFLIYMSICHTSSYVKGQWRTRQVLCDKLELMTL